MVTFVLKSNLDKNAKPWLPQGRGQEYKEGEAVEEEDSGSGQEYKEGEDIEMGDKNTEQHDGNDFSDIEVEAEAKDVLKSGVVVQRLDTIVETMSVE